jgi:hypothetical protein
MYGTYIAHPTFTEMSYNKEAKTVIVTDIVLFTTIRLLHNNKQQYVAMKI